MTKKSLTLLLVLAIISSKLVAQDNVPTITDSLELKLKKAKTESERAYILCDIIEEFYGADSTRLRQYSSEAFAIFQKQKDSFGLAKVYKARGNLFFNYDNMKAAQEQYELSNKVLERLIQKDSSKKLLDQWSNSTLSLASSLGNQGLTNEEIKCLLRVAPIAEKYNDFSASAHINTNLALAYNAISDYEKACEYFNGNERFYQLAPPPRNNYAYDRLMYAYCLINVDSLTKADNILNFASIILKETPDSHDWQLYHAVTGYYYGSLKKYNDALASYDKALQIITKKNMPGDAIALYGEYALLYEKMGDLVNAKKYMLKVYHSVKGANRAEEAEVLRKLSEYESDDSKALAYLNEFLDLNDSLQLEERVLETAALGEQFQKEKKEREIAELKNQNSEKALSLERKKSQNYIMYILSGGLVSILGMSFLVFRNRQRKNQLTLKTREKELNDFKGEQKRKLLEAMIDATEEERQRLALDLHDGLGGRLASANTSLMKFEEELKSVEQSHKIKGIVHILKNSLKELRNIARNLMPETLMKHGLKTALEDFCSTIVDKEPKITIQFYGSEQLSDKNRLLILYRIVQEAITNSVKHSKAKEILVQYIQENNTIDITIEDDGLGFNVNEALKKEGLGLSNLYNRVQFLGGKLDIKSNKEGTSINIQIPIQNG